MSDGFEKCQVLRIRPAEKWKRMNMSSRVGRQRLLFDCTVG